MKVTILEEHGHENALLGLSLSFYDHAQPLRHDHRLKYWKQFCKDILEQLQYPQYIKLSGV